VGLKSLKSLNLTNVYPNNNTKNNKNHKKNNNKVKSKPLEIYELVGKFFFGKSIFIAFLVHNFPRRADIFQGPGRGGDTQPDPSAYMK
jgi:hypothetical protein